MERHQAQGMIKVLKLLLLAPLTLAFTACGGDIESPPGAGFDFNDPEPPEFKNVSVHDPSVMRDSDGTYYIVGSHLASAKSTDLMKWEQISSNPTPGNKLVPDFKEDMKEALTWAKTSTFWAGDWIRLKDGKYYMYYCNCEGSSPLSCLGLAASEHPDGPYENQGIFLKSGMTTEYAPDGTFYDATVHPNAIDPHVFFDKDGVYWMVYGSYSGGIYIMRMDETTGLPLPDQGYGKKLLGGNHARIEAPYMMYSPDTGYYYLFLSFGGLDANGAYNIRVARSENPDGPFVDALGQDMIDCMGAKGSFFDDRSIEGYGVKLMGNYRFDPTPQESTQKVTGYVSPGHNSTYYDSETGQYYIIFHTRFEKSGESHQVRVHQMFMGPDGWPLIAPVRYGGESVRSFTAKELAGTYKLLSHGTKITEEIVASKTAFFTANGKIKGSFSGSWKLGEDGYSVKIKLDGVEYSGLFLRQYDNDSKQHVMTFTAISTGGITLWGCGEGE